MERRKLLKHCLSVALLAALASSLTLGIKALYGDNAESGIATLHFDIASSFEHAIFGKRDFPKPGFIDSIQTEAGNIPGAVSKVQTAADAAATAVSSAIEEAFPKNCSVGTRKFCVGLSKSLSCHNLPLSLSDIIPPEVEKPFQDAFSDISAFDKLLKEVTTPYIRNSLTTGLISISTAGIIFIYSIYGQVLNSVCNVIKAKVWILLLYFTFGLIFSSPFLIPTVILYILRSKVDQLPAWIQVQQGDVYKLCLGSLFYAVSVVAIGCVALVLRLHGRDPGGFERPNYKKSVVPL